MSYELDDCRRLRRLIICGSLRSPSYCYIPAPPATEPFVYSPLALASLGLARPQTAKYRRRLLCGRLYLCGIWLGHAFAADGSHYALATGSLRSPAVLSPPPEKLRSLECRAAVSTANGDFMHGSAVMICSLAADDIQSSALMIYSTSC